MARKIRVAMFVLMLLFAFKTSASADSREVKTVRLVVDNEEKTILTYADTVEDVLKREKINIDAKDKINIALDEKLKDVETNVIKIVTGNMVSVVIDENEPIEMKLAEGGKVGHLIQELKEANDTEYAYDGYLNDDIKDGDTIYVKTQTVKEFTAVEKIEFETEVLETYDLPVGEEKVEQEGELGEITVTTLVKYQGNEEVSREETSREITKEPVKKIILSGKKIELPKVPETAFEYSAVFTMEASAYSAKQAGLSNYTRSGDLAVYGVVAVDPNVIPLGTWLYIEGYGKALASDTGGAIKGNKIDLCYNSVEECFTFGRRDVKVYVLAEGN